MIFRRKWLAKRDWWPLYCLKYKAVDHRLHFDACFVSFEREQITYEANSFGKKTKEIWRSKNANNIKKNVAEPKHIANIFK